MIIVEPWRGLCEGDEGTVRGGVCEEASADSSSAIWPTVCVDTTRSSTRWTEKHDRLRVLISTASVSAARMIISDGNTQRRTSRPCRCWERALFNSKRSTVNLLADYLNFYRPRPSLNSHGRSEAVNQHCFSGVRRCVGMSGCFWVRGIDGEVHESIISPFDGLLCLTAPASLLTSHRANC